MQYVGIAIDEPKRLARLEGTNKVSLLDKYGYTEVMAMEKCKDYALVSPCYSSDYRGGVGSARMQISAGIATYARIIQSIGVC